MGHLYHISGTRAEEAGRSWETEKVDEHNEAVISEHDRTWTENECDRVLKTCTKISQTKIKAANHQIIIFSDE